MSLPYDAQSRERIAEQMARAMTKVRFPHWGGTQSLFDEKLARAALTAIEPKENK